MLPTTDIAKQYGVYVHNELVFALIVGTVIIICIVAVLTVANIRISYQIRVQVRSGQVS